MEKRLVLCFLALFLFPASVSAQRPFAVVAAAQVHGMKPRFADDQLVNARISVSTRVYRSLTVGALVGLSPTVALQATAGFSSYGLAVRRQLDYSKHRYENSDLSSTRTNALEFAVVARRSFAGIKNSNHGWFTDAGLDVFYLGNHGEIGSIGGLGIGNSNIGPNGPGISGSVDAVSGNSYRLGLRVGIGHEWAPHPRHTLALELLASYGLRDLQRFQMQYVVWEQGPAIDPKSYTNTLATRFSFVGLQAAYRFQTSRVPPAPLREGH